MGWGDCGTDSKGRPIGYVHAATCDHPGCDAKIERGLGYACGGMHGTGEGGCEGYFCEKHLYHVEDPHEQIGRQKGFAVVCEACRNEHNARLVEDLIEELKELREEQTMMPTDAQLARLRETLRPTIEDWARDYGHTLGKEHVQLENRLVAALMAMHEAGTITINRKAEGPEGGA